jgi:proteasome lid subunit RPN8/RPN11
MLMHNHPSGDPSPSQADIRMTRSIVDIARPLGIAVHDRIIVGRNGHASLKGMRLTSFAHRTTSVVSVETDLDLHPNVPP